MNIYLIFTCSKLTIGTLKICFKVYKKHQNDIIDVVLMFFVFIMFEHI